MLRKKIIIADDSATMRMIVSTVLKAQGWEVYTACDGGEAIALARAQVPDLVITDWNMPGLGGLDVVQALRADAATQAVPILVLTTEDDAQSKDAARRLGVNGWIYKPVDPNLLVEVATAQLLGEAS